MPKTNSVVIGDHFVDFIERQEALRAALIEGEQSGASTPFDIEEFLDEMRSTRASQR